MPYIVLADAVLLAHLAFVLFAVFGGLVVRRRPRLAALHLPALAWGVWVEFSGTICPLTYLEVHLRMRAGEAGYHGSFIGHYVGELLYPPGLTHGMQLVLGALLLAFNLLVYAGLLRRAFRRTRGRRAGSGTGPASPADPHPPGAQASPPGSRRSPDTPR